MASQEPMAGSPLRHFSLTVLGRMRLCLRGVDGVLVSGVILTGNRANGQSARPVFPLWCSSSPRIPKELGVGTVGRVVLDRGRLRSIFHSEGRQREIRFELFSTQECDTRSAATGLPVGACGMAAGVTMDASKTPMLKTLASSSWIRITRAQVPAHQFAITPAAIRYGGVRTMTS